MKRKNGCYRRFFTWGAETVPKSLLNSHFIWLIFTLKFILENRKIIKYDGNSMQITAEKMMDFQKEDL